MAGAPTTRIALVTGATSGIGRATAEGLARLGFETVVHGRDPARTRAVADEIGAATGNTRIHAIVADLASLSAVGGMADEFHARFDRLDVLVNNAGLSTWERGRSADGHELTFAVNHLAHFLLTLLLLDRLRASAPSRIVNVASRAHRWSRLDFDDLQSERRWLGYDAYARSKLANILFTKELARRLTGSGVTANALHPGVIGTNLTLIRPLRWLLPGPRRGARASLYLATSPEVQGTSGAYFVRRRAVDPSPAARDDSDARRLWEESEKLVAPFLRRA